MDAAVTISVSRSSLTRSGGGGGAAEEERLGGARVKQGWRKEGNKAVVIPSEYCH